MKHGPSLSPKPVITSAKRKVGSSARNRARWLICCGTLGQNENRDVDYAFQELSRLQARRPENRSEELSVQRKIQELKGVLSKLEPQRR